MKKAMLIFIISAMLTACGNVADTQPPVNEETMTVSQTAKEKSCTTASEMTETAVSSTTTESSLISETSSAQTTSTSKSTESTARAVISTTESAVYTQRTGSAAETESKHIVTTV